MYHPEGYSGITEAQFSIPYCIAALLHEPKPGPHWFEEQRLKDMKILELAGRVRATGPLLSPLDGFAMFHAGTYPEAGVEVTLKDGRNVSERLPFPKGHPKNRLTEDEFKDRFRLAASYTINSDLIEKVIETIDDLENIDDLNALTQLTHN